MRLPIAFALVVVLALGAGTGTASADVAGGRTTGGGIVASGDGPFVPFHITVNARGGDVPSGRVAIHSADVDFVGAVSCYVQVGDTVEIAGPIVKSHDLAVGSGFYSLSIVDGGEGEDLIAFNAVEGVALPCGGAGGAPMPLASGNVRVHGE